MFDLIKGIAKDKWMAGAIACCTILVSCHSSTDQGVRNSGEKLRTQINSVLVDYVIEKRDWCRFSRLFFILEVENLSENEICIKAFPEFNWCENEEAVTTFEIVDSYVSAIHSLERFRSSRLIVTNVLSDTCIGSGDKLTLRLMPLTTIKAFSVSEVRFRYKEFLNAPFRIVTTDLIPNDTLVFTKEAQFKIEYAIDDSIIDHLPEQ